MDSDHAMRTKQRHEKRCLPRASWTNDHVDLAALEDNFFLDPEREVATARSRSDRAVVRVRPSERRLADPDRVALNGTRGNDQLG